MLSSIRAIIADSLAAPLPADYDDLLARAEPQRTQPRRAPVLLLVLLLAALIPRAFMASRLDTACVDGIWYFHLADQLEQEQRVANDGGRLQFGTYPLVLSVLHRAGFDWETAAKLYGVAVSTLAVLPLFGWVRRQFDDRVAAIACLLYAAHPKLIEWSPEAIREPSFWLFFLTALYFLWRAATEVNLRCFVLGGAFTALACLTRFEGWFLLFPLCGWTALRFVRLPSARWRLTTGLAGAACAIPVVFYAFGLLLPSGADWRVLRTEPIERAGAWVQSWFNPVETRVSTVDTEVAAEGQRRMAAASAAEASAIAHATPAATPAAAQAPATNSAAATPPAAQPLPIASANAPLAAAPLPMTAAPTESSDVVAPPTQSTEPWTFADALWVFLRTFERGLTPLFALLMFGGCFARMRMFNRLEHLPISLIVFAVCGGVWVHLWYSHLASSRYVLTVVLLATRPAAIGLIACAQFLSEKVPRRSASTIPALSSGLLVLFILVGTIDALSSDFRSRDALAGVGRWIRANYGDAATIAGSENQMPLVGYYARAHAVQLPSGLTHDELMGWMTVVNPQVVVISTRGTRAAEYETLLDNCARLGLERIPADQFPSGTRNMIVLGHARSATPVIEQASRPPSAGS